MASATEKYLRPFYGNYVDGQEAEGANGAKFDILNPYTDKPVTTVAEASAEDVAAAIKSARKAFDEGPWPKMAPKERARILNAAAAELRSRTDEFAHIESACTGRAIKEMVAQLKRIPEWIEYFAAIAMGSEGTVPPFSDPGHLNYVRRIPLGVCALITPWNHPTLILCKKLSVALATGNTVVVKPSELAPCAVILLADIFSRAGLPKGVFNVVNGFGAVTGRALTESPLINKIDLTGGTATGKIVAAAAGRSLIPVVAELGGNAPILVFPDCDFENTVNGVAFASFVASGQTCVSGKRVIVHKDIAEKFTKALVAKAESIRLGDPSLVSTQMGPVVSRNQQKIILEQISSAPADGCTILTGGKAPEAPEFATGYFIEPTIISNPHSKTRVFQEEVFGPCITITVFEDEADALRLANDNDFALGASIWTNSLHLAHRVAHNLEAGVQWINCHHRNDPSSPWGGWKQSGMGRENGWEALHEYTQTKSVVIPLETKPFDWFGDSKRYG